MKISFIDCSYVYGCPKCPYDWHSSDKSYKCPKCGATVSTDDMISGDG